MKNRMFSAHDVLTVKIRLRFFLSYIGFFRSIGAKKITAADAKVCRNFDWKELV